VTVAPSLPINADTCINPTQHDPPMGGMNKATRQPGFAKRVEVGGGLWASQERRATEGGGGGGVLSGRKYGKGGGVG